MAEGSLQNLGFALCRDCSFPVAAFDYFGKRFQCIDCNNLFEIDSIRHRFEPQHDLARKGIKCEECYRRQPSGNRNIDRRFDAKARKLPKPGDTVEKAVSAFTSYLWSYKGRRRKWRLEALERYRRELMEATPFAETRFADIVRLPSRAPWHWEQQIVLLDAYIVDFYCERTRLVVEIDGDDHVSDPKLFWDQVRDAHLRRNGYEIMRFWNGTLMAGLHDEDVRSQVETVYNDRHREIHGRVSFHD